MNEVHVDLDELGRVRLRRAGEGSGVYTLETTEALRAFFQAERDQELGWWRDPEEPDWVVYPHESYNDTVVVYNERTRTTSFTHRSATETSSGNYSSIRVAKRYFATHLDPEPRPWEEAKPGEVWALTYAGIEETAWVADFTWGAPPRFRQFKNLLNPIFTNDKHITAGRRIWPEGEDK